MVAVYNPGKGGEMAEKITSIIEARAKRRYRSNNALNHLIERAHILKNGLSDYAGTILKSSEFGTLERYFEAKISDTLFSLKVVDGTGVFLCGIYIANMLANLSKTVPESWYVIDFILEGVETKNPVILKNGADLCFLFCSLFKERSEHRSMTGDSYKRFGISLYYRYFAATDKIIGLHMSDNFSVMAEVTKKSISKLIRD